MAMFKSISLADQVFEKLESDIISGVYPRGEYFNNGAEHISALCLSVFPVAHKKTPG